MRIRMTTTKHGSRDGKVTETFHKGNFYDLRSTEREVELAKVFLREGWAEEDDRHVERLPLIEEYVRRGYPRESYASFVEKAKQTADAEGLIVEFRAMNAEELAEEKRRSDEVAKLEAERAEKAAAEKAQLEAAEAAAKQVADEKATRDAGAAAVSAEPLPDAAPTPPVNVEPAEKGKNNGKGRK